MLRSCLLFTLTLALATPSVLAEKNADLYINQNIGFNVEGYKYTQQEFPCQLDQLLVSHLIDESEQRQIQARAIGSYEEINNGVIPVLAIDVEQLVLTEDVQYGPKSQHPLPKVAVNTALVVGDEVVMQPHSCAITALSEFTSSSNILDMGTVATVCTAINRCVNRMSDDIIEWVQPKIQ